MSTREFIKMQSINFCYMDYMLQACQTNTIDIEDEHIKFIMNENDTVIVMMQDGTIENAIDVDPEISTQTIKGWIAKHPELHERVIALMNN